MDWGYDPGAKGPSHVFVFGSNMAGYHGRGAAHTAVRDYGAQAGTWTGRTGMAYAIPTKDQYMVSLPLEAIRRYVSRFIEYARSNRDQQFFVTRIGCGLAGYSDSDIAPLFSGCPSNCLLPRTWAEYL